MVVVIEVGFSQVEDRLLLQRQHERAAQRGKQRPVLILILGAGDIGGLFRGFQPQLPLVPPFMQVADTGGKVSPGERLPYPLMRNELRAIRQ